MAMHDSSNLLSPEENQTVCSILGNRKQSKATAVVQMFHATPDKSTWAKYKTGVLCFVKDNTKKAYYMRLVDVNAKTIPYEQEIYNQFTYKKDYKYFHSFSGDKFMVGLNFASEQEAEKFYDAVITKLQENQDRSTRRMTIKRQTEDPQTATKIGKPPVSPINDSNDPFSKDRIRPKKLGKKKINKADIGRPTDFRHLSHVGFDPQTGAFDSSNIQPEWKKLLDTVGVTSEQLEDKDTAEFIYDFVEKHGGIQEATRQLTSPPPPPPPQHQSKSHRGGKRDKPPPRPQNSSRTPAPPPPPPVGVPAPPPPPPIGGPAPPRPPPSISLSASRAAPPSPAPPPRVDDGRGNLLASIRAGITLKTVSADEAGGGGGDEELEGMAGALARALASRSNAIQASDEDEDDWVDEEDEDEWGSD